MPRRIRDVDFTQERAGTIASAIQVAVAANTLAASANTLAASANTLAASANTSATSANTLAISANTLATLANTTAAAITTWSVVSANTTAVKNRSYFVDTSSLSVTIQIPANFTSTVGDFIKFSDVSGTWSSNALIIEPSGTAIQGNGYNHRISTKNGAIAITYSGNTSRGWIVTESANTANVLTPTSTEARPAIGQPYGGGYFAGEFSLNSANAANGIVEYWLIVAPKSSGERTDINQVGSSGSSIDGLTNSWVAGIGWSNNLSIGGYSWANGNGWYHPSVGEYEMLYNAFKPASNTNSVGGGGSVYSIPNRSAYTETTPGQTSIPDFKSPTGSEYFWPNFTAGEAFYQNPSGDIYASSTLGFSYYIVAFSFKDGSSGWTYNYYNRRARAVRRIPKLGQLR